MTSYRLLVTLTATGLVLAGCSGSTDSTTQAEHDPAAALTVYSNQLTHGRDTWLIDQAQKAGFALEVVDVDHGDIRNRLTTDNDTPPADVVFGFDSIIFHQLSDEGRLQKFTPSWANDITATPDTAGNMFWPTVTGPVMLICYDEAPRKVDSLPQLWNDLNFHAHYQTPAHMDGSLPQAIVTGILAGHPDDNGNFGVDEDGWGTLSAYFKNGAKQLSDVDLYARMRDGAIYCGQVSPATNSAFDDTYGIATTPVHQPDGVPMITQHIGMVANTKHPDQAQKFIDWFGSADVQGAWSKQFHTTPVNTKAQKLGDAEAIALTNSFTAQDIDWAWAAKNMDGWKKKILLEFQR